MCEIRMVNKYFRKGLTGLALIIGGATIYGASIWVNSPKPWPSFSQKVVYNTSSLKNYSHINEVYSTLVAEFVHQHEIDFFEFRIVTDIPPCFKRLIKSKENDKEIVYSPIQNLPSLVEYERWVKEYYIQEINDLATRLKKIGDKDKDKKIKVLEKLLQITQRYHYQGYSLTTRKVE